MAELLRDVNDLQRLRNLEARLKFYIVSVPEDGKATCLGPIDTVDQLAEHVRPLLGPLGQVFIFLAERWNLTRGPLKFLVPPPGGGDRVPLFQSPELLEVDPEGGTSLDPTDPEDAVSRDT